MSGSLERALIARDIGDRASGIFARRAIPELGVICNTKHMAALLRGGF
jgi:hypothetical protein